MRHQQVMTQHARAQPTPDPVGDGVAHHGADDAAADDGEGVQHACRHQSARRNQQARRRHEGADDDQRLKEGHRAKDHAGPHGVAGDEIGGRGKQTVHTDPLPEGIWDHGL